MKKINLVHIGDTLVFTLSTPWQSYEFANTIPYDCDHTYSKDTTFIVNDFAIPDNKSLLLSLLDKGHKLIIDSVWEAFSNHGYKLASKYPDQTLLMYCGTTDFYPNVNTLLTPNFFWIREYMYNTHYGLDLYKPQPRPVKSKAFLLALNKEKIHRDLTVVKLGHRLDDALYSYVSQGIELPFGHGNFVHHTGSYDRMFDSDWYDSTYFSLVVETEVSGTVQEIRSTGMSRHSPQFNGVYVSGNNSVFLTEKTFKPIAFQHPFIHYAQYGAIARIKSLGFETFDHIFSDAYDTVLSANARLNKVIDTIDNMNPAHYHNPRTYDMIKHNYDLFYNESKVKAMLYEELVDPIRAFIE